MPSSISSSKSRTPQGGWGKVWWVAGLTILLALVVGEGVLRGAGFTPSVSEDEDLWAVHRSSVYPKYPGEEVLVLLGGSRMQLDVSPGEVSEALDGMRVVQLAIDGANAIPVLQDMGQDSAFAGRVIVSIAAFQFYGSPGRSAEYVSHFRNSDMTLVRRLNVVGGAWIQSRFAIRNSHVSLRSTFQELIAEGRLPSPNYIRMLPDRSKLADYTLLDLAEHRADRLDGDRLGLLRFGPAGPAQDVLSNGLADVNQAVDRIQARGGRVALVRFPTGEALYAQGNEVFPRELFWDRFAAGSRAMTLHFEDVPGFKKFTFPDESHLDYRDAPEFSRVLIQALRDMGFFQGP